MSKGDGFSARYNDVRKLDYIYLAEEIIFNIPV